MTHGSVATQVKDEYVDNIHNNVMTRMKGQTVRLCQSTAGTKITWRSVRSPG